MRSSTYQQLESLRENNVVALKEAKEAGQHIVGMYCLYSPAELIVAAGASPVMLCGTSQKPIPIAEQSLPRNLCPLIKSSYGFAATDTCPFFYFSDFIVAETTCDGKKKMYELLEEFKPVHLLQLPQIQDKDTALNYWLSELNLLKEKLEQTFNVEITEQKLRDAIELLNDERRSLKELQDVCRHKPAPISGIEMLTVLHNRGFALDKRATIKLVDQLTSELNERAKEGISTLAADAPRILLTGVPVGLGSEKVVRIIEESGGQVVCFESCGAYKKVEPVRQSEDPLRDIAECYLAIPCSCMSPNTSRYDLVTNLAREFQVDGVIDLTWQACHTYNIESFSLRKHMQQEVNLPFLQIETDYSESDSEQLKLRLEAFLELLADQ
ncbi:MAG: 2-hydroxyacyl-CoA dehydratase [Deltaproteobacteria bacterium]|nr:2-hydroxyacyl-CoA dehydratase [Deltaproteobacteria bacterium]